MKRRKMWESKGEKTKRMGYEEEINEEEKRKCRKRKRKTVLGEERAK